MLKLTCRFQSTNSDSSQGQSSEGPLPRLATGGGVGCACLCSSYIMLTRQGFYVNLPVGAVAAVAIVLLRIPEQRRKESALTILSKLHRYLDLVGFALFAPAVLQLLLALQYGGNQFPWNSSRVIGLFCGSAATLVVWLFWNRHKGDDALLPHSMISRRAVWASGIYQAFLMAAVYGGIYFLPIYFQSINNATPILSGVYLLPTILPQLVMAASSGAISKSDARATSV